MGKVQRQHAIEKWGARRSEAPVIRNNDVRNVYERDRARVIHSSSFRRLQGKTQVLGISEGDFHRTRLTHSMEVAQIGRGIVQFLKYTDRSVINPEIEKYLETSALIETVCFCHDLGHPPFGHSGEKALNYMMRDHGGFEGNGQSLRILARLESYQPSFGLNLTRRTLLGILKYPASYSAVHKKNRITAADFESINKDDVKPPKCYMASEEDVVQWILEPFPANERDLFQSFIPDPSEDEKHSKTLFKSFDTSIMNLADDIAYGVHDFEDGIALKLIRREHWNQLEPAFGKTWARVKQLASFDKLGDELFSQEGYRRKRAIGSLVNAFITSARLKTLEQFKSPLLRYNVTFEPAAEKFLDALMGAAVEHIIKIQSVQSLEYRGRLMIMKMFEALESDPLSLLTESSARDYEEADDLDKKRVICDYIAGMTDAYASKFYQRLFVPGFGTVFERL